MSDTRIRSGGHKAVFAQVTPKGELLVHGSSDPEISKISEIDRLSFEFHPHSFSLPAGVYIPVLYMKNTSSDMNFHIESVRFGWNGGDTTFIRTMGFRMYRSMTKPDANVVEGKFGVGDGPHNLHLGSEVEPQMDMSFFDNTGALGMTMSGVAMSDTELGDQINCGPLDKGSTPLDYHGALIMPPSMSFGIGLKGGEAGKGICVIKGYYKEIAQ